MQVGCAGKVEKGEDLAKSSRPSHPPPCNPCSAIWCPPNLLMGPEEELLIPRGAPPPWQRASPPPCIFLSKNPYKCCCIKVYILRHSMRGWGAMVSLPKCLLLFLLYPCLQRIQSFCCLLGWMIGTILSPNWSANGYPSVHFFRGNFIPFEGRDPSFPLRKSSDHFKKIRSKNIN